MFDEAWQYLREKFTPGDVAALSYEVWVTRDVDSFEFYLTELLRELFVQRPETLRSSDSVTVREVLEAGTLDAFIKEVAEKKVLTLAFGGLRSITDYLERQLGLSIDRTTPSFTLSTEAIEVRNIIAHNAGLVSDLFLRRTGRADLKAGVKFPLSVDYAASVSKALFNLSLTIDSAFITHFKLWDTSQVSSDDVQGS